MDIDKFIKDKGLKVDCIVESDLDVKQYVQYEVRDLIKEAVNEQLRLYIVTNSLEQKVEDMQREINRLKEFTGLDHL